MAFSGRQLLRLCQPLTDYPEGQVSSALAPPSGVTAVRAGSIGPPGFLTGYDYDDECTCRDVCDGADYRASAGVLGVSGRACWGFCGCNPRGFEPPPPPPGPDHDQTGPAKLPRPVGRRHLSPLVLTLIWTRRSSALGQNNSCVSLNLCCDWLICRLQSSNHGQRLPDSNKVLPVPAQPPLLCEYLTFLTTGSD